MESVEELLHDIWGQLMDRNIMKAMEMLKDARCYSEEQVAYLEGIATSPFGEEGDAEDEK